MGLLDKLKNVFFEEEYIEEEIKPKKEKDEAPIAKKIDLPENNTVSQSIEKEVAAVESAIIETGEDQEELKKESSFKFPMNFEEEDFRQDTLAEIPIIREGKHEKEEEPEEENDSFYHRPYSTREEKREVTTFKPSPIISPIYGVLDRNYKKEEIVSKKEIRLSSSPKKIDVDSVREKAYGDLASEITASIMDEDDEEDILYDLNNENSPAVAKVTVGDAEEYFNDLGLEYNVDYEDTSTKQKTGRRSGKKAILEVEEEEGDDEEEIVVLTEGVEEENEEIDKEKEEEKSRESDEETAIEDNLFDLIDSMYEDKE